MSDGFAIVPKSLLQDRELHAISKSLYTYLASYADKNGRAYPPRSLICADLGISKDTMTKYLKQLTDKGYVSVEKNKAHGRFGNNVYILTVPKPSDTVLSDTVLSDTVKWSVTEPNINKPIYNMTMNKKGVRARDKPAKRYGEFNHVLLTDSELSKLISDFGESVADDYIGRLDSYVERTGKQYRNHALTIRSWIERDRERQKEKQTTTQANYADFNAFFGGGDE